MKETPKFQEIFISFQFNILTISMNSMDRSLWPEHSYIDTRDYPDPEKLGQYLKYLNENPGKISEGVTYKYTKKNNHVNFSKICGVFLVERFLRNPLSCHGIYASIVWALSKASQSQWTSEGATILFQSDIYCKWQILLFSGTMTWQIGG